MITLCARRMRERTTAPTGHPRSHAAPTGASAGENPLARIWHGYLIFAASAPLAAAVQTVSSHPGWLVTGYLAAGGRPGFASAQAAPAVFGTAPLLRWARLMHRV
jgi:hypothetical protein